MNENIAANEAQSRTCTNSGAQPCCAVFIGVDALIKRLTVLALSVTDIRVNSEINNIASELFLLDAALGRLQNDRSWIDVEDIDRFIARLRSV